MSQPLQQPAPRGERYSENNLVWVDMEMSGLNPDSDRVLEIAIVITDSELEVVAEGPVLVLHQSDAVLGGMDNWNTSTHGRSGLTAKVRESTMDESMASDLLLAFMQQHVPPGKSPMCGNSICQDRRFMARWMPRLEACFHYRNLDVSTLKELARRWNPAVYRSFEKKSRHEALADIYESIDELKHYRTHWLGARTTL
ncbi:MAG TPA: oligoribonuclease [Burkholderiaceae bacterium]|nr:oligoribonuclease [Burkholderiaceae bacterium]